MCLSMSKNKKKLKLMGVKVKRIYSGLLFEFQIYHFLVKQLGTDCCDDSKLQFPHLRNGINIKELQGPLTHKPHVISFTLTLSYFLSNTSFS